MKFKDTSLKNLIQVRDGNVHGQVILAGQDLIETLSDLTTDITILCSQADSDQFPEAKIVRERDLCKIAGTKTFMGICALATIKQPAMPLLGKFIVLDGVQDPGNVGTIFRSCASAGISGIILSDQCCKVTHPKVLRGSRGWSLKLPSVRVNNDVLYKSFNPKMTWISKKDGINFEKAKTKINSSKIAFLIFGSEGQGVSYQWNDSCNAFWIDSKIESLNVACATSITTYGLMQTS